MNRTALANVLIEALGEDINLTRVKATAVIEALEAAMVQTLLAGESVQVAGFGKLSTKTRKATQKSHPQNPGQMVNVPAKRVVKFTTFTDLRNTLNA